MKKGIYEREADNLLAVITKLLESEVLSQCLVNLDENPLGTPVEVPDTSLLFNKIYPLPKVPALSENKGAYVTVNFVDTEPYKSNSEYVKQLLVVDIIVHIDLWKIKGSLRPSLMADAIIDILSEKIIINGASVGMSGIDNFKSKIKYYEPDYFGRSLVFRVDDIK